MNFVDRFLNSTTMYRLVNYGLMLLAALSLIFAYTGLISYSGNGMLLSFFIATVTCYVSNLIFAKMWKAPVNAESSSITALILFFLFTPVMQMEDIWVLVAACLIAMLSKYLIAWQGKHAFNPAAFGAAAMSASGFGGAVWWVANPWLLPFTTVLGFLIARKIRRLPMFFVTVGASTVVGTALGISVGLPFIDALVQHFVSWPIIFFASVMVTEPLTTPAKRGSQIVYGALVGAVSSWPISIGNIYFTPELTLLLGNFFSYARSLRRRLFLTLKEKHTIARDTYEFVFDLSPPLVFEPGQYLEWTLAQAKTDSRGNRRYFTIASSPTEKEMRLGVKIMDKRSTFKNQLADMKPGDTMVAGSLAGDFALPVDTQKPLAFIAGGIGITPFRSMVKYLVDKNEHRDIVLFYSNRTQADIAYKNVFDSAASIGLKTLYVLTDPGAAQGNQPAKIDKAQIETDVPDYKHRLWYLSGPSGMVDAYKALLTDMGVHRTSIRTDYFPGF